MGLTLYSYPRVWDLDRASDPPIRPPGRSCGGTETWPELLKSMDVHTIYLITLYCVSAADLDKAYSVIDEAADMLALVDHWVPTGLRRRPLLEA
jgi:hypothetical protein